MSYKGKYVVKNKAKYMGDLDKVTYRSSWELRLMRYLDSNVDVIRWGSEPFPIEYYNPVKDRPAQYFPDFIVQVKRPDHSIQTMLVEIKPRKQTKRPSQSKSPTKKAYRRFLRDTATYAVNTAKWKAAETFCEEQGWSWKILTEVQIFNDRNAK